MASDQNDSSMSKARSAAQSIPGVEIIATASQRASRKMSAVQRTPFGRRVFDVIRTLIWVVPLTVLVWLYAERETIDEQVLSVPVTIQSERADRMVTFASSADRVLSIKIKGTRIRIQQARDELARKQGLQIVVPAKLGLGLQVAMPAMEAINANPVFWQRGITVIACTPGTLSLQVDEVVQAMDFRPEIPQEIASRLDGQAVLDPPTVMLTGPRRALVGAETPVEVVADITVQMLPKVGGEIPAVPVRLKTPNDQITITPATLKARVKLKSSSISYTIASVPVFVYGPPKLFDQYQVNLTPLSRVTVVGPQEEIAKISSGDFIPKALLEVTQQDVRERLPRSPSMYVLPPNVTVSDEDKNRTITFELVERTKAE
jgi:hypothetical protein